MGYAHRTERPVLAHAVAAHGARVVVAGRHGVSNSPVPVIEADLAAPEGADLVARQAAGMLGGLDIVVHCAGASFSRAGGALGLTGEDWMRALSTNLLFPIFTYWS